MSTMTKHTAPKAGLQVGEIISINTLPYTVVAKLPDGDILIGGDALLYGFRKGQQHPVLINPKACAQKLVSDLTEREVGYATDAARGEYRGFAALHDLCDANMLLPYAQEVEDYNSDVLVGFWNAVMECVNDLLKNPAPRTHALNIPEKVEAVALQEGLKFSQTGGGCDFVVRYLKDSTLVLMNHDGECPEMDEESTVVEFADDQWSEVIDTTVYPNVSKAIEAMKGAI